MRTDNANNGTTQLSLRNRALVTGACGVSVDRFTIIVRITLGKEGAGGGGVLSGTRKNSVLNSIGRDRDP